MFTIIKGGCFSRHASDFHMQRPNGLPYFVLLLIKSDAEITIADKTHLCKPDSALFLRPGIPYSYYNPKGEYIDDWLHFTCSEEDLLLFPEELFYQSFPVQNARQLTTYIQQILWENNYTEPKNRDFYVDSLFRVLLKHLTEDFLDKPDTAYTPYRYKLQNIRLELHSAPYNKYTAESFSKRLGISTSYFQTLYKSMFHIPFQADIINMRIEYAKELITCTNQPFEQIAESCGYANEVHFYRQFLAKTGMTPGDYRKNYSS